MAVFSRQDLLSERQVYRTTGSLVAWWAWAAFAAVLLVALALGHHDHAALVTAFVVVAITGIMYACALHPRIVASATDVTVVNPLRVHVLPWPSVTKVDLEHNVRVHYRGPAGDALVHSWAVQSSGRSRTRSELRARRAARRGMAPAPGYAKLPGEAQAALAGSAAEFIARQLDDRARTQRSPARPDAASPGPQVRWTWGPIAAIAVPLLMLLVVALA
ncbi:MAG TPA: PH domain-containing protein [Streptosporangiaceae bacterium]